MLNLLGRLFTYFLSNMLALWVASRFVTGFKIPDSLIDLAWLAIVLTLLNVFIRPIFKLILSPIILLTLGLGIILVNMSTLYLLKLALPDYIAISGLLPLFYATLIVGLVNMVAHFLFKPHK